MWESKKKPGQGKKLNVRNLFEVLYCIHKSEKLKECSRGNYSAVKDIMFQSDCHKAAVNTEYINPKCEWCGQVCKVESYEYPYTYLDGLTMSTRDVVRVMRTRLHNKEKLIAMWDTNKYIRMLKENRPTLITLSNINLGAGKMSSRLEFKLTKYGNERLADGMYFLAPYMDDELNALNYFPTPLKEEYMPTRVKLLDT